MSEEIKFPKLVERMRKSGQTLCAGFTIYGNRVFWLEPSQKKVKEGSALRAITSPFVQAQDGGLFGDQPQSYKVVAP